MTSGRPLEPRDARPKILLDPPVEREQLAGGLLPGFRLADGAHVILAAFAPAALPFIMPEVQYSFPSIRRTRRPQPTRISIPRFYLCLEVSRRSRTAPSRRARRTSEPRCRSSA